MLFLCCFAWIQPPMYMYKIIISFYVNLYFDHLLEDSPLSSSPVPCFLFPVLSVQLAVIADESKYHQSAPVPSI